MPEQNLVYFAGDLFNHKDLTGNLLLAEAIEKESSGRYVCVLPQHLEQSTNRSIDIRNNDLSKIVSALEPDQSKKRVENLKLLNYTTLQCVGDDRKEEIVIEEIQPDLMIEDRPKLIEAFHRAGIKVIFPDWHPYTRGMECFSTPFYLWN